MTKEVIVGYRFHIGDSKGGQPSWWLYAGNNEKVAWAGETFASLSNARRAAVAFKAGASAASFEVYEDAGTKWRWRAIRGGNKVAASGESFASRSNAQRAADNVRDNARFATID
ncbi:MULTISPECIES: DUF1508 domain-containing protein [Nocardiaceae]|uniref:Uncharacterized protein YegP (UPF0339 family) n=1 Tax=Rhodococcoides corynebacterioides TaxID=53972 RepID=A0ABS2KY38_9NOCA|nr:MULTISPECIES: DUF1508 domain-containing protein [Rhodococcus]MBM7416845.1 uncharacterized protein YegP (UPF0339 family) [Rhodococcus corynebacterioides]MBP1115098.1 uncharacterized protein YegP (UPF0339 family) [Rhodococcus sp. PvP016]